MKYSLGVPFTERFFQLALFGNGEPAGYVGMITTNSFMKREFGKKLIEEYLPQPGSHACHRHFRRLYSRTRHADCDSLWSAPQASKRKGAGSAGYSG